MGILPYNIPTETTLFVGGSLDGQRRSVEGHPDIVLGVGTEKYRRVTMEDTDSEYRIIFYIPVTFKVYQALNLLVQSYTPP